MLALSARTYLAAKAERQRRERQPLRSLSHIFKAEQGPADPRYVSPAWRRFFAPFKPAAERMLDADVQRGSDHARADLLPQSGARFTLAVLS
jgi:hypothetical protein